MPSVIMTNWQIHAQLLAHIRRQVFIEEQQVPVADEWDGLDETAIHFLVQDEHQAIGCARLLIDEINHQKHFHIGRVAVVKPFRAHGIGQQLMAFILDYCIKTAPYPVYLHAQTERRAFYERLGFVVKGQAFMDAGIPHITMFWQPAE